MPAIIQVEHRQVNINSSSRCLQCPLNPEKGIFPFNPLWQDRWHLQPNLAPGRCFSRYQLRCVSSTVSITRMCRTTRTLARSIFHLITSCPLGHLATAQKGLQRKKVRVTSELETSWYTQGGPRKFFLKVLFVETL